MKLNKKISLYILGSLLSGSFIFASQQAEVSKLCAKPIGCQLYKFCVERYNQEYNTDINVPEKDEVTDFDLQQELRELSLLISFVDKKGNHIIPGINPKKNELRLYLMEDGNECVDFECAKAVIELYEQPHPVGRLGLIEKFDEMKQGNLLCRVCNTTDMPNIPSKKQFKRK